nr:hypothetical protein [Humibacter albus]
MLLRLPFESCANRYSAERNCFAATYAGYLRGSNEHFNGRLRHYLPEGTSFDNLTQDELDELIAEINDRPRKILGWATPAEIFHELAWGPTTTT